MKVLAKLVLVLVLFFSHSNHSLSEPAHETDRTVNVEIIINCIDIHIGINAICFQEHRSSGTIFLHVHSLSGQISLLVRQTDGVVNLVWHRDAI